jgi:DNA polymerase-1
MKKDDLFLLDGYSLIYRSYFAFIHRPLTNPEGKNVSAFFGFFRTLMGILESHNPRYFAVVMDSRVPTFRHEMYPEYKATREKAPEDLHDQVPMIEEVLHAVGIRLVQKDRYEADDIIATLARACSREQRRCHIISGDKDLLQLIDPYVGALQPDNGSFRSMGPTEVKEKLGITPAQVVDYLALIGDTSDNVPGVKGIGPKTASRLLSAWNTLDGIYEHLEECTKSERRKLEEGRESAYLSRDLVILRDVEGFGENIEEYSLEKVNLLAGIPLFLQQGARSLAEQAGAVRFGGTRISAASPSSVSPDLSGPGSYVSVDSIRQLKEWLDRVKTSRRFAFDVETTSLNEMEAEPVGFSISVRSGEACYIPLKAGNKNILPEDEVRELLRPVLEDESLELAGHNFKYDYKVLHRWGVRVSNICFDTMVAAWLVDSTAASYGMDHLAEQYLNYRTLHYKEVVPKGELFSSVPLEKATRYAAEDADITYRFYEFFAKRLEEEGLVDLFKNLEMPVLRILADMELRGIRLLGNRLVEYAAELEKELGNIEREIYREVGYEFNINSTKQLQEVLFVDRKLKPVKKTKTGYSTDLKVLEQLSSEDLVPQLVLQHRGLSKLKSTYVDTLPQLVDRETGRIHTSFSQTGTATGRLSSRDPNLQNIPIRDEAGRRIRKAFVPEEGWKLISADYSQIELVVLAHLSGDPELVNTFKSGGDVHSRTASLIFGVPEDEITAEQRRIAKTINFGVMYGMSGFRLSQELKIPRAKADEFITAYFNRYSGINRFIRETVEETEKKGYAVTMLGRRREIPGINSRNRTEKSGAERIAVNTPIQGTAADIVKLAMLALDRRIREEKLPLRMLLQIHDELIFEAPEDKIEESVKLIRESMENVVELSVPLKVGIEIGDSWGDLH